MSVTAIYAVGSNGEFGFAGKLPPWDCEADMHLFQIATHGAAVIMGRGTAESLPKPLKNRLNIIVTRKTPGKLRKIYRAWRYNELYVPTLEEALAIAQKYREDVYVIGGFKLIQEALPHCDAVRRTVIEGTYPADIYAEELPPEWEKVVSAEGAGFELQLLLPMGRVRDQLEIEEMLRTGGEVC